MEPLKRLCKAVRRVVTVLDGNVDDLGVRARQRLGDQRHPARADVFTDGHAAQGPEDALIVEGRQRSLSRDPVDVQRLAQVLLDEVNGLLEPFAPALHTDCPLSVA